jgi:hypothetical protein
MPAPLLNYLADSCSSNWMPPWPGLECHEQRNFAADEQRNSAAGCASLSKYSLTRF